MSTVGDRVEVLPDTSADNIAPSDPAPTTFADAAAATSAPMTTPQQPPEFFNLTVALQMISANYERDFPKLSFNTPHQIVDGSVAEFIDTSMGVTIATARIRIRNRLVVNNENGELTMVVHLSDMTFARPSVNLTVSRK